MPFLLVLLGMTAVGAHLRSHAVRQRTGHGGHGGHGGHRRGGGGGWWGGPGWWGPELVVVDDDWVWDPRSGMYVRRSEMYGR